MGVIKCVWGWAIRVREKIVVLVCWANGGDEEPGALVVC